MTALKKMKKLFFILFLSLISINSWSQSCTILSKANNITPDRLCAPVSVNWEVTYTGVNNAGTPVSIFYDWDDGSTETRPAVQTSPGVFMSVASHTYISRRLVCNYHPRATLIVNGVRCTSSTQEQIVTVWDNDDNNGGEMRINPPIWPICFGNSDNARFQDLTQFNCVPPQERDNPNVNTRWVQWIYGTDITMTGIPVTINGRSETFPYIGNVITLPGPVTGSGVWSDVINVANDKLVGQYFEITLRNWNYCNPYDDPTIPEPPIDRVNGDHAPVETTAIILIVPYPDATITQVSPMCENEPPIALTAATIGGTWTGAGITGNIFNPSIAGPGNHIIRYQITDANNCNDEDTILIRVKPVPRAIITPVPLLCEPDPPVALSAIDTGGVWIGTGVTDGVFYPLVAGVGNHLVRYEISLDGCSNSDSIYITVATPDATINPIDTLCVDDPPVTLTAHDMGGIWSGNGVIDDKFYPFIAGVGTHMITYLLVNPACSDIDTALITVMPIPIIDIENVPTQYINSSPVTLNATPTGGIWSGPGISGNIFNPQVAGLGNHIITYYTLPDRWGCDNWDTLHINVIMPPTPIAYWEPDTSGCAPLAVSFRNLSLYGETYIWDFGDGVFSNEQNPTHEYFTPGSYIVRLTVTNIVGSSSYQGVIHVYQNSIAIFNGYPLNVINKEQIVIFENNSYYAETYLWDFGDGTTSTEKNPWHKYENEGIYNVILYTWSKDNCPDSASLVTPVIVKWEEGQIAFPNAFKWNGVGPTGGVWHEGAYPEMDFVFRPHFENVIEYKLQIFNRWGVLIFESEDIYKGWDGYWGNGNLAVQGVYVWKATGRFADGNYFYKVGDVTFLH